MHTTALPSDVRRRLCPAVTVQPNDRATPFLLISHARAQPMVLFKALRRGRAAASHRTAKPREVATYPEDAQSHRGFDLSHLADCCCKNRTRYARLRRASEYAGLR